MSELKCCPFCGGKVAISDEKIDATREVYNFHCHNCDMVTFYDFPNDKEKAIETWNTRKPMDNIVEKLEENSFDMSLENPDCKAIWTDKAINIVKQEMGVMNNEPTNN